MLHYMMLEHQVNRRQAERAHEAATERLLRLAARSPAESPARISHLADRQQLAAEATGHDAERSHKVPA